MARRPVGVIETQTEYLVVVCDDGSVWLRVPPLGHPNLGRDEDTWTQLEPPIPGSPADETVRRGD